MRLEQNPILSEGGSFLFTLQRLFRLIAQVANSTADKVDGLAGGRASAVDGKQASIPTTGDYEQGDFVKNSAPVELGIIGSKFVVEGWLNVAAGSPGTFVECRSLTGN